jgi:hypothetical protein
MKVGRKTIERDWHHCLRCGLLVVTKKLHGRPLRRWHAECWAIHRGFGTKVRPVDADLPAAEIERVIADAAAAQRAVWSQGR